MNKPQLEVADILSRHASNYPYLLSREQARVLCALQVCRTAHLGGHLERCDSCGDERPAYNSCRDRHCPKCQSLARAQWVAKQKADLLPVPYFHLVFTMPGELTELTQQNQQVLYDILFQTMASTLTTIGADPKHLGAEIGFLAVLHTWGQTLQAHPHLHCIVPGGGLSLDGKKWVSRGEEFFLPVKVLSRLYRGRFVSALRTAYEQGELEFHGQLEHLAKPKMFNRLLRKLSAKEWVVYAKRPFGGPEQVLEYVGRYTHRVAISNHRLIKQEDGKVSFGYKDYRRSKDGEKAVQSIMVLEANEFIRRFLLHVLPRGFVRIRRYGILANRKREAKLTRCRELLEAAPPALVEALSWQESYEKLTGSSLNSCRKCEQGKMEVIKVLPSFWEQLQRLTLGLYLPTCWLSRAMADSFIRKSQELEKKLASPWPSSLSSQPTQALDSS